MENSVFVKERTWKVNEPGGLSMPGRVADGGKISGISRLQAVTGPRSVAILIGYMEKGDREMFIEQVRQHHASLRGFVRALGVDPLWVDDVAQEAFIVAYQRLDEFDQGRDFGAWLRGIARNLVINERRKDARRKRILSDNLTDVLLATSSVSDQDDEEMGDSALAKLQALKGCLEDLPPKSRSLLKARYEDEIPAQDMADQFAMNPPALRKALERLRTALRKCMEERLAPSPA
jgi:RNA polymerase sigma-70 factor (ECF subfamily)